MSDPLRCLRCKHCHIDFGCGGYSDATPGTPGEWRCNKDRWSIGDYDERDAVLKALAKGENCPHWEHDGRTPLPEGRP